MMASSSSRVAACLLLLAVVGVSAELRNSNNVRTARKNDDPCPLCAHDHPSSADSVLPADMHVLRLQAIKSQLLSKLRLQHRPNVSLDVPRKVLLETVQRSGDPSTSFNDLDRGPPEPPPDDVLPVTSEIITFASPGEFKFSETIGIGITLLTNYRMHSDINAAAHHHSWWALNIQVFFIDFKLLTQSSNFPLHKYQFPNGDLLLSTN